MSQASIVAVILTLLPLAVSLGLIRKLQRFSSRPWIWLPFASLAIGAAIIVALPSALGIGVATVGFGYQLWVVGPFLALFKRAFGVLLPAWPTSGLIQQLGYAILFAVMLLPPIAMLWWLN